MKKKKKVFILITMMLTLIAGVGVTYSILKSNGDGDSINKNIAKFVFNTNTLDELELSLIDMNPGDTEEYLFSISNSENEITSNVLVEYQLTIKTYHFVPLTIELYKIVNEEDILVLNCDETYTRDENNELVCNSEIQELGYSSEQNDDYKLKITFPSEYDDDTYSNLADFLNVEITSWQKTGD